MVLTACSEPSRPAAEVVADREDGHAMHLPEGIGREPMPKGAIEIHLHRDVLTLGDRYVAPIEGGQIAAHERDGHEVRPLLELLKPNEGKGTLVLHADRALPWGTLVDVLYTAAHAEYESVYPAMSGTPPSVGFVMGRPRSWMPPDNVHAEPMCGMNVAFDGARLRVAPCSDDTITIAADDFAAMRAVARSAAERRLERLIRFNAPPAVPWATVVAILDALGGELCPPDAPDPDARHCRPPAVLVDLDPPIVYRHRNARR